MARVYEPTATGVAQLLAYSNTLMGALEQGGGTSQLWQAVQAAEAEGGPLLSNVTIFDMNYVAGQLRSVLGGEANFMAAGPEQAITGDMWAWAPWATQSTAEYMQPNYQIRYEYEVTGPDGSVSPLWGQVDWPGQLPDTVGDVLDRAASSAQISLDTQSEGVQAQLGFTEGVSFNRISRLQLLRF